MDCTLIGKRQPTVPHGRVPGGLLGLGDLHAGMGDGEIVVVGAEVAGLVRLRPDLVQLPGLPTPFLRTTRLSRPSTPIQTWTWPRMAPFAT